MKNVMLLSPTVSNRKHLPPMTVCFGTVLGSNAIHRLILLSSLLWFLSIFAYHFIPPFQSFVEDVFIFSPRPTTYYYAITPEQDFNNQRLPNSRFGVFAEASPYHGVIRTRMANDENGNAIANANGGRKVAITYADK